MESLFVFGGVLRRWFCVESLFVSAVDWRGCIVSLFERETVSQLERETGRAVLGRQP